MAKQKTKANPLDDILGGEFFKMDLLVGKRFTVLGYETENVAGYKTPSVKFEIKFDGETKTYSSFSGVLLKQAKKIEDKMGFPITLGIVARESESGNNYLTFTK